jgi:hypothetical protein
MDHQTGTYTISIRLALAPQHRRRLEHVVRTRRVAPSDLVSALIAGAEPQPVDQEARRTDTVPLLIYLTAEQRAAFQTFAGAHEIDLGALISELVAHHLEDLPDPPVPPATRNLPAELQALQRELARLQAKREQLGPGAPRWLDTYIADLELDIGQHKQQR